MGQYYQCLAQDKSELKCYSLQFKNWKRGDSDDYKRYNGIKLMEHSWWENDFLKTLNLKLYNHPMKVAWVGDYAGGKTEEKLGDEELCENTLYELAWKLIPQEDIDEKTKGMSLDGKVLLNHTKQTYLDCDSYFERCKVKEGDKCWCIHPLPVLTAVGNGRGGGDYGGVNTADVGCWAWDELEVLDKADVPEDYKEVKYIFKED